MKTECTECEKQSMLKAADLSIENMNLKKNIKLLENCLDTSYELNKVLRTDNEGLRNKLEIYVGEQ